MAPTFHDNQSITTKSDDVIRIISSLVTRSPLLSSIPVIENGQRNNGIIIANTSESTTDRPHGGQGETDGFNNYFPFAAVTQAASKGVLKLRSGEEQIGGGGGGGRIVEASDIMHKHFSEFGDLNITSSVWRNFTAFSYRVPSGFFKDVIEPVICGSGIIGIILTMIVLSRKTMVTSTNCYLTALAVGDLLYLLILLSRIIVDKIDDWDFQTGDQMALYSHYAEIFMATSCYTTIGVTVMLAVERYIAICQPMQAMTLCSVKRARIAIVIIAVIAVIIISPRFTELEFTYSAHKNSDEKVLVVWWISRYNEQVYVWIVQVFLVTLLPLCCLLALNIRLIIEIRRSTRYLQVCLGAADRSVVTQEELKITVMLISVVVAFFVCQAPYMVFSLLTGMYKRDLIQQNEFITGDSWTVFRQFVQCMLALKSACNFILYCWFSEKFWITFKRLFCLRHCLARQGTHQTNGCSNNNSNNNHHRPSCYITRETTC